MLLKSVGGLFGSRVWKPGSPNGTVKEVVRYDPPASVAPWHQPWTPIGKALAQWPKQFEVARAKCGAAPDPVAASEVFVEEIRTFLNSCRAMADPQNADVFEDMLQSVVLEPHYEGLMDRLRQAHRNKEQHLEGLRRRLQGRPQVDFTIPATHVDPNEWQLPRSLLSQINNSHTALGQLGCIVKAVEAVYAVVKDNSRASGKTLTVGADEFTVIHEQSSLPLHAMTQSVLKDCCVCVCSRSSSTLC